MPTEKGQLHADRPFVLLEERGRSAARYSDEFTSRRARRGAFASNARNPSVRRAQLAFLGACTAEWVFTVALGIVAYRAAGATAVGLVGLLRMVPSAVVAPLASPLADRGRRERVLVLVSTVRGVATALAAIVVGLAGPPQMVYLLAVVSTTAASLFRPAHSAQLSSLCRTGYERLIRSGFAVVWVPWSRALLR